MGAEALPTNSHTDEVLPRNGKDTGSFGRGRFGFGRFGGNNEREPDHEALPANSHSEEALSATKIS